MDYYHELKFVEKLLHNFRLNMRYITEDTVGSSPERVVGLKDILNYEYDERTLFQIISTHCKPNVIYQLKNALLCQYLVFRLPESERPAFVYIGPYTLKPVTKQEILSLADHYQMAPGKLAQLEQFYMDLPLISDENGLLTLLYTLGEFIWDNADNFTLLETFDFPSYLPQSILPAPDIHTPEEALKRS